MDIKLPPKKWYVKYRIHMIAGLLGVALIILLVKVSTGPRVIRVSSESVQTGTVTMGDFSEYINAEGTLQPIQTLKIYTREGGYVERIVAQDGAMVHKGDTILVLSDPDLERTIQDARNQWRKQDRSFRTQIIEMQQRDISLQRSIMQTQYELSRLEKQHALDQEEYKMGFKSKAQLEVADDEYNYKLKSTQLEIESRRQDSVLNAIRREAMQDELEDARRQLARSEARLKDLVITAPADGQLSGMSLEPGLRVGAGSAIGDVKRMDAFRMKLSINEYYIDKVDVGCPATITYEKKTYPMEVSGTVPEIKSGSFDIYLVFTDSIPDNARIGKSYQARIELGGQAQSVIVPKGNFYNYTHGQWVFRLNEQGTRAVRVPVSIGRQNPRQYEVLEGLNPGDVIITTGYDRIADADEVVLEK
ncbi:MAG: HlyD family efflux transporter periplasmic adaptor subunit [Bacteroidaceae bacterium]|nr:HlyD family efflux transporter periplasmic adaptor subunit [Bacteroidaceae bacterium]